MSTRNPTTSAPYVHPADPAGYLKPDESLLVGGLDWSWAFVWIKDVVGFPGYKISHDGVAWSCWTRKSRGRWLGTKAVMTSQWKRLVPIEFHAGHLFVNLRTDSGKRQKRIHHLVLEAFVGPCPKGMEACHRDDVPSNNVLWNLRWDTRKSNKADAVRNGRAARGERHGSSRFTDDQIRRIREEFAAGGLTYEELARRHGTIKTQIFKIVKRETWKHVV